jgi:hypothetical protein
MSGYTFGLTSKDNKDNFVHVDDFRKMATQRQMLLDNQDILFIIDNQNMNINKFCDSVLAKIADKDGYVEKKRCLEYLAVYANGVEVRRSFEHYKAMKFDEKYMETVFEILNKPLPDLYVEYGQIAVQLMFNMFEVYCKRWWNMERYKKIYKSENPLKWVEKVKEYPDTDSMKTLAEYKNYAQIMRKVQDILNTKIKI